MRDSYNRRVNYMRISITDLCNLRCIYCMPEEGVCKKSHDEVLSFEEITKIVKVSADLGIDKIRITGGEPLVKNGIVDFISSISQIEGIKDIAMTTNGVLLERYIEDLKEAGLKRVNISIDSLNPERYKTITRGGDISQVLKGIDKTIELGMTPVKINVVVIGGHNEDEVEDFARLTMDKNIEVRFIELMPLGQAAEWARESFVSNESIKEKIGSLIELPHERSSPAKHYQLPNAVGKVGFINPISDHFCGECNRIRLTSDGKLKPCLHSNQEIDILQAARSNPKALREILESAILSKPKEHHITSEDHDTVKRNMSQIGG